MLDTKRVMESVDNRTRPMKLKRILSLLVAIVLAGNELLFAQGSHDLTWVVQKATEHYNTLQFSQAESLLKNKLNEIKSRGVSPEESPSLIPAYKLLGVVYHANGQTDLALQAFTEVIRIEPETVLSETEYAPRVRDLFNQAKQKFLAEQDQFGEVRISSSPKGAKIFLDGLLKGETPLQIRGIPPGSHAVTLNKEGFSPKMTSVGISTGSSAKLQLTLDKLPKETVAVEKPEPKRHERVAEKFKTNKNDEPTATKSFWKKPAVWIVGGILLAGAGAGLGLSLSSGGSGSAVTIRAPVPGLTFK